MGGGQWAVSGQRHSARGQYRQPRPPVGSSQMNSGESLTLATIWVSIAGYVVGSVIFALSSSSERRLLWDSVVRVIWTIACASLIAHFISAFHFHHGWSHAAAYRDTARQTEELFGVSWGGGLFINYALLIAWIVDIGWWWRSGIDSYRKRRWPVVALWHGLFIFIIFNATVVFVNGIVRWVGLGVSLILTIAWWRIVRQ